MKQTGWHSINRVWGGRAALVILALWLSGCFDGKNASTSPPDNPASSLDLVVSVSGAGQVSSIPAGIDCGSDCTEALISGSDITLTATPSSGFIFSGWSGDCSGSTASCTLTMSARRATTATFIASPTPNPTPGGDSTPPTVSLSTPAPGDVSGTVLLSANASDNVAVAGVQFRVNGVDHGSEDTTAPYNMSWNTASLSPGGTYVLSAVARDTAGLTTISTGVTVTVRAPPPTPQGLIFFDNFEYEVGRNDPNAASLFQQHGRWNGAKTEQSGAPGANGFLYTVNSIPGYAGDFPGGPSSRVLAMEARPGSEGFQTDFYVEYGDGENPAFNEAIPGNVWFQFWVYINHYENPLVPAENQLSFIDSRNKFIYACNGSYPCHTAKWLLSVGNESVEPHWVSLGQPSSTGAFLTNTANVFDGVSEITNSGAAELENRNKLGQTDTSQHMAANRWTLVKIHLDTSTQSGRFEMWMQPRGGIWIKTAEWIDGVTSGFTWRIDPAHVGGHRTFRMPSTMGRASVGPGQQNYDTWIYMDDFAMATTEAALPQYP